MNPRKDEWKRHETEIKPLVARDLGLVDVIMKDVLPFTKPLFLREGLNRVPVQVGSSIVARLGNEVFLFTAAHAMDNFRRREVFIPLDGQYVQPEGPVFRNDPGPSGVHGDDDAVDTAVLHIKGAHQARLKEIAYPLEEAMYFRTVVPAACVAVGYPLRLSKKVERQIFSDAMGWLLESRDLDFYIKRNINPAQNMAFTMSKRVATEHGFAPLPALRGMSGCGVWLAPRISGIEQPHRLVGIFTGISRRDGVALATSLVRHIQCIAHVLPHLVRLIKTSENDRIYRLAVNS